MPDGNEGAKIVETVRRLRDAVMRVTLEEFRWQEHHYDRDARQGRELLFLIANDEWVRATAEIVDITRSDTVDTAIKIDVDLDQIAHEAFRGRTGRLWLPVLVLPSQAATGAPRSSDQHRPVPDRFTTVTDATGGSLAMVPNATVRHRISAAMAAITVNMAVARWPGQDELSPTATRDQQLLLSAAFYRLLRWGSAEPPPWASAVRPRLSRIDNAKAQLLALFGPFIGPLSDGYSGVASIDAANNTIPVESKSSETAGFKRPEAPLFVPRLARHAVQVLEAFAESVVVVVPIDRESTPTVLTVRVPSRGVDLGRTWKWAHPSTWILRPLGHLQIDLLLPFAGADRQVQVNLPDGVYCEDQGMARPNMVIEVRPQPVKDLAVLMGQLLDPPQHNWPASLQQCLADLAAAKAEAVEQIPGQYWVGFAADQSNDPTREREAATAEARATLHKLRAELEQLLIGSSAQEVTLEKIREAWGTFYRLTRGLLRPTSVDRPLPRTVVARADMMEDMSPWAMTTNAKVHVYVRVPDAQYFSIARFSGGMSVLLMTVVLVFFRVAGLLDYNGAPNPDVLAFVLTLFSAIQAGRIERPDRSTLRGLLSASGNWLIVASILPTVILAVVIAFSPNRSGEVMWAEFCIGLQLLLQLAMWHGPLSAAGSPHQVGRRQFRTESPDYRHSETLRSKWWRSVTAEVLMHGHDVYAYVVPQEGSSATLTELLMGARQASPRLLGEELTISAPRSPSSGGTESTVRTVPGSQADVLALLRSGTVGQTLTFVMFRGEPIPDWAAPAYARQLDLDPNRVFPLESVTSTVDVLVGVPRDGEVLRVAYHPLAGILHAARHCLMVLEVQLPVPAPVATSIDLNWVRVRFALRDDDDIRRLAPFLSAIHKWATAADAKHQGWVVGVQTAPVGGPRIITRLAASARPDRLVMASDIDVVTGVANGQESADARSWQVLAICADARSGIENDILQRLARVRPQLRLAGMSYALLHGTAVVLLLGHQPDRNPGQDADLETDLRMDRSLGELRVLVNDWRSREQLGCAQRHPLLRIHARSQDQPGSLLALLDSLNKVLRDELPSLTNSWKIWHAQKQITAGHGALTRLTVGLHTEPWMVEDWSRSIFDRIEQKVRTLVAHNSGGSFGDGLEAAEDPVISVNLIRTGLHS